MEGPLWARTVRRFGKGSEAPTIHLTLVMKTGNRNNEVRKG